MLKNLIICFIFYIFSVEATSFDAISNKREVKIVTTALQFIKISQIKETQIWPGLDLALSPLILTFATEHLYGLNLKISQHQLKSNLWKTLYIADEHVQYLEEDRFQLSKIPMQTNVVIEGQNSFVFNFDQPHYSLQKLFEIFLHERFHLYQFVHFPKALYLTGYADSFNSDNLAWMQVEEKLLATFLADKATDQQKIEILKDLIAAMTYRRLLIAYESSQWEDHQQIMEGLADYVSLKFLDQLALSKQATGVTKLQQTLISYVTQQNSADRVLKWRHYGIGAALGYALDFLAVKEWKQTIEKGQSLFQLLAHSLVIDQQEIVECLQVLKITYSVAKLTQQIKKQVNQHQHKLQRLDKQFKELKGISLCIGRLATDKISGGGTTAQAIYLANGSTLSLRDSSLMVNSDKSWQLELKEVPFALQTAQGERKFKIEEEAEIILDEKTHSLQELLKNPGCYPFNIIAINGKTCAFKAEHKRGILMIHTAQEVSVEFN